MFHTESTPAWFLINYISKTPEKIRWIFLGIHFLTMNLPCDEFSCDKSSGINFIKTDRLVSFFKQILCPFSFRFFNTFRFLDSRWDIPHNDISTIIVQKMRDVDENRFILSTPTRSGLEVKSSLRVYGIAGVSFLVVWSDSV